MLGPNPHSCDTCRNRFSIYDDAKRRGLPITAERTFLWRLWDPEQKSITIGDLRSMSFTGCAFAKFLINKFETKQEALLDDHHVIHRYPPAAYEEWPDSLVISTDGRWVLLALMARPGSCGAHSTIDIGIEHLWLMNSSRQSSGLRSVSPYPTFVSRIFRISATSKALDAHVHSKPSILRKTTSEAYANQSP